ncbi:MAG: SDR family NAD(P)-dependent oxidoreductase, partial [Rhodobacteraceae bacterium]|nr:SDR family NAD(P)-dependent oxidoreductase [Paracoccaceae bacterium]
MGFSSAFVTRRGLTGMLAAIGFMAAAAHGAHAATVLVTGANRGMGLEFVKQYAAKGDTVIATARTPAKADELNELAKGNGNIIVDELDVTDLAQIDALAAKYKDTAIDVLINNA